MLEWLTRVRTWRVESTLYEDDTEEEVMVSSAFDPIDVDVGLGIQVFLAGPETIIDFAPASEAEVWRTLSWGTHAPNDYEGLGPNWGVRVEAGGENGTLYDVGLFWGGALTRERPLAYTPNVGEFAPRFTCQILLYGDSTNEVDLKPSPYPTNAKWVVDGLEWTLYGGGPAASILFGSITWTPVRWWGYDPGDGGGPIWDATTGAKLRPNYMPPA